MTSREARKELKVVHAEIKRCRKELRRMVDRREEPILRSRIDFLYRQAEALELPEAYG